MDMVEFPIEFHSKSDEFDGELQDLAIRRLNDLRGDHTDMVSASVTLDSVAHSETPHALQARVVVHTRPDRVVATNKADSSATALKGALDAVERQVREKRAKLKEHWKRPDLNQGPA